MSKTVDEERSSFSFQPSPRDPIVIVAIIVALVVLVGFGIFLLHMLELINVEEKAWIRSVYLFSSVEALAFAAAGFLFGREVNRQRADHAEALASEALESMRINAERAASAEASGRKLAEKVNATLAEQERRKQEVSSLTAEQLFNVTTEDLRELKQSSEVLFPNG